MGGGEPRFLAKGQDGLATSPQWSNDGKWISFLVWGTPRTASLYIKPAAGGEERLLGSVCNDQVAWTSDGRHLIASNNGDTDDPSKCRLTVVSIEPGETPVQLGMLGMSPALSSDGKTVAFVRGREIHLLPVTPEGRPAGAEKTLVTESIDVTEPEWVPHTDDLVYSFFEDRSVLRRIAARPGAMPRDSTIIDGEFESLSFARAGEQVVAGVYLHDDSYWRIDLQSPNPRSEKIRHLPWNVHNLTLTPDGRSVLYTVSTRGRSEFYMSNIDGSAPRRLFSIPYYGVSRPVWSPDGKQIAFAASLVLGQIPPSHLFIAAIDGPPRRLAKQFDYVYYVNWSHDGRALYFSDQADQKSWRLNLADGKVVETKQPQPGIREGLLSPDGRFRYEERHQPPKNSVMLLESLR